MNNIREVFQAFLDGKKIVDSTCPSAYTYMYINKDNLLCGVIADKDSKENIYLLAGNWRFISKPEAYKIYSEENL